MKFFLDENIPVSIADTIIKLGFEAEHARNAGLLGAADKEIASYAKKQKFILITRDLEFGNLLVYPANSHYGVIIIRVPSSLKSKQLETALKNLLAQIDVSSLANSITVLELGRYRIRRIKKSDKNPN